jgi:hypothetical protein
LEPRTEQGVSFGSKSCQREKGSMMSVLRSIELGLSKLSARTLPLIASAGKTNATHDS